MPTGRRAEEGTRTLSRRKPARAEGGRLAPNRGRHPRSSIAGLDSRCRPRKDRDLAPTKPGTEVVDIDHFMGVQDWKREPGERPARRTGRDTVYGGLVAARCGRVVRHCRAGTACCDAQLLGVCLHQVVGLWGRGANQRAQRWLAFFVAAYPRSCAPAIPSKAANVDVYVLHPASGKPGDQVESPHHKGAGLPPPANVYNADSLDSAESRSR